MRRLARVSRPSDEILADSIDMPLGPVEQFVPLHALPCPSWQAALLALSAEIAGGLGGD